MTKPPQRNVATSVDLSQEICTHGICQTERNNLIMYRDSNHLTASFAKQLQSALENR